MSEVTARSYAESLAFKIKMIEAVMSDDTATIEQNQQYVDEMLAEFDELSDEEANEFEYNFNGVDFFNDVLELVVEVRQDDRREVSRIRALAAYGGPTAWIVWDPFEHGESYFAVIASWWSSPETVTVYAPNLTAALREYAEGR